jgi:hypothetical protein
MSVSRAHALLLDKIGASTGITLCAILLKLETPLAGADGLDSDGRSIVLVGKSALGSDPIAQQAIYQILTYLALGDCPDPVHPVAFAPKASLAIATAVTAEQDAEILVHGPRNTGKTHALAAIAMIQAEWHLRAGFHGPLLVAWLHDSLLSAATKTGRSLQLPMWGGLWKLKDDSRRALCTIGGHELVSGDFIGCKDDEANQRLRIEVNLVLGEELVASMTDGTGITEQQWDLARSSTLRLPTRHRLAVAATNPGGPETWPYVRWLKYPTLPRLHAIAVPQTDRMTPEEQAANRAVFAYSPILQKRLADGEWIMAEQGQAVAEGFEQTIHVTAQPLRPSPGLLLGLGWDGGHSPSCVIGQNHQGQLQVYAALNEMNVGVLELIEQQIQPWLLEHAPWVIQNHGIDLVHIIDPNMATPGQSTITESAERMILAKLGGRIVRGPVRWPPRREAVLRVLAPRHEQGLIPLRIREGLDTDLLVQSLAGRWYYPEANGQVDRTGAKKPNSPWADIGDAFANLAGWLLGGDLMVIPQAGELKVETVSSLDNFLTMR